MIRLATTENDARIHHYAEVTKDPRIEWLGTISEPYNETSLAGIDALLISCDNYLPSRIAAAACGTLGIPVFHILDGVVDWRTTFENPKYDSKHHGTPLFQPLIANHVFTLGPLQQLQMRHLGNGNAHATGLPRLDRIKRRPCRIGDAAESPSLLIATANTPWATDQQRDQLIREFRQLHTHLQKSNLQTTYRISQELAEKTAISADNTGSATQALEKCTALITTPSTMAVEAMLSGVPTLIFDPFALPVFTPSAWVATHWQSLIASLPSLLSPTKPLATYQDDLCQFIAIGDGSATQRVADKIVATFENQDVAPPTSATPGKIEDAQKIHALSQTIAALEAQLHEATHKQQSTEHTIFQPDLQFVIKSAARYLKQSIKGRK